MSPFEMQNYRKNVHRKTIYGAQMTAHIFKCNFDSVLLY